VGGSQTGDYSIFKISRSWSEAEATWENASNGQKWSKAGGDYVSTAIAKVTAWPRTNGKTWVPYNVLATVQEFVKNPSANFGFMAVNTKSSQEIDFASSENTTADQRPKLTITYNAATAVMPAIAPAVRKGVTLRTQHRDLHLFAPASLSKIAVYRADGSLVMTRELAAGEHAIVSGLGAGVYFIRAGNARERGYTAVSLLP
jgi:hypothetical protein